MHFIQEKKKKKTMHFKIPSLKKEDRLHLPSFYVCIPPLLPVV